MDFEAQIIRSASERSLHIAQAVSWFSQELNTNQNFCYVFLTLLRAIAETSTEAQNNGIRHQLICVGVGKSGSVAALAATMFASVGVFARFLHPSEALHGDLGVVCEHDTILCISNQGASHEIMQLIPKLRERSCRIFGLTSKPNSPLGNASDYVVALPSLPEACPLHEAPITSTVAALAFCQLLVAASIEFREFGIANYARNHPGGSIGKRIYLKVSDVMVTGQALPFVKATELFPLCVSALTKYAMSVLLVVDASNTLLGVISEKDMRIAMEKYEKLVFEKQAASLMNTTPITINSSMLALDALRLMKDRPRPLNFLPVVDSQNVVQGLLRIHDLIAAGIGLV